MELAWILTPGILGLCWGSFLNVLAYRGLHHRTVFTVRSYCPACKHVIPWYDNIPLLSWVLRRGHCRFCSSSISLLYPFVELTTAVLVAGLYITMHPYQCTVQWLGSFVSRLLFLSALVAATRTDLEGMVIPQIFSIWLAPFGILAAACGFLQISLLQSFMGALFGYGLLWSIALLFKKATSKDGMGIGDMELLALIGSFLGPVGVWIALMISSLVGLACGLLYIVWSKQSTQVRIPFGPFLALGAVVYFFFGSYLLQTIFPVASVDDFVLLLR